MITGDNIYTAIHIASKVGIIENERKIWVGKYEEKWKKIEWILYDIKSSKND